jgi:hypothetical protein
LDAQKYVDGLHEQGDVLRLASFDGNGWCNGRGKAIVIDRKESMAIMLENCGRVTITNVKQGAVVKFSKKPGGEPHIVGSPAYC